VNPFDPSLSIPWPISQEEAVISAKDSLNPPLSQVLPIAGSPILVSGSNGQLGSVFLKKLTNGLAIQRDLSDLPKLGFRPSAIVNCAAYTAVDAAEKFEERSNVMNANFEIPLKLANYGLLNDVPVIHFSSDYVFNGEKSSPYSEIDPESPESVYGFSKHLGDVATRNNPRHYIIRTSWVYGESRNFVKIMAEKAGKLERVSVVDDQIGRPTYAPDIVEFALTLLRRNAPYGTYNFSGGGDPISWYELARFVYESVGAPQSLVEPVSTETYLSHNPHAAPRPKNSVLDLSKLSEFGIKAKDWQVSVLEYLALAP
jgi:dTDP-4-dehydrorhamnose 3,5-epimerase